MIDGRNCTHGALFPHFPARDISFAATLGPVTLLDSVRTGRQRHNSFVCVIRKTINVN